MIPMPGKIIVKQDGGSEQRGRILVSQRFAEKDRPMTGRVLAVGVGKRIEVSLLEIRKRLGEALYSALGKTTLATADVLTVHVAAIFAEERQSRPVSVKAGDRVVFRVFAGDGIEWTDGSMCRCLEESDILARLED